MAEPYLLTKGFRHTMAIATPSQKTPRRYATQLELFQQCPRRYFHKVVERRAVDEAFSFALHKGKVAHEVLKLCGIELRDTCTVPADLRPLVATRLPRAMYPSDAAWEADVTEVVQWIKYGLAYLDPYATILGVELFQDRTYRSPASDTAVSLGAVIDLVLLRTDANGERFVEVVDYKTGRNLDQSRFAPVITRFVLKPLLAQHFPGKEFASVVFTELYLAQRFPRSRELTLPACLEAWEHVTQTIATIEAEQTWEPNPSPLCQWCPFNGHGCQAAQTAAEDSSSLW
jgi:hypothetical protein